MTDAHMLTLVAACDCGWEELGPASMTAHDIADDHEQENPGHIVRVEVPPETPGAEARNLILAKCREVLRILDSSSPAHTPQCSCGWVGSEWPTAEGSWAEADRHGLQVHGEISRVTA